MMEQFDDLRQQQRFISITKPEKSLVFYLFYLIKGTMPTLNGVVKDRDIFYVWGMWFRPMVYLAEFAVVGTMELAAEILIVANSEKDAHVCALQYASHWGFDLFSLQLTNEQHLHLCDARHLDMVTQLTA